jgi:hypothetical protein
MTTALTVQESIDTTRRLLARLDGVQTCRDGWRARCPCCGTARALTVGVDNFAFAFVGLDCGVGCGRARLYAAVGLPAPQRWAM